MSGSKGSGNGKRILIIVENLPLPFDRRVWLEAMALRDAGYEVTTISPKGKGMERSSEMLDGIRVLRYGTFEAKTRRTAFILEFLWCWLCTLALSIRAAFPKRLHVIQACNPPDTFFAIGRIHRLFGTKFIFDQHDLCPEMYRAKYPEREGDFMHRMLVTLENLTYRWASAVIVTNDSYGDFAKRRGGVPEEKVFVVRTGPDPERIVEVEPDPAERHGRPYAIGYLGTMSVHDGVDGLLRTFERIVKEHGRTDVQLVLVGGGPLLEELQAQAKTMGIDSSVTFHGRVPNGERFCRILSSMDLCVSPDPDSTYNNLSTMNKTMEYMAFGRPVVAYGLKETMVSGGDAAIYVEPGNEDHLARTILELLDDPAGREEASRRGRERVRGHLAWEHSVPHLKAAYEYALSNA
ncbi:glycosyltransferase family 4 protein [bacterium]|nr:glycosyltransferase family 4 protein [bacterium]